MMICDFVSATGLQTVIKGKVVYADTNEPAAGVNVMLYAADGDKMYGFTTVDEAGKYHFEQDVPSDSVMVMVVGFNVKKESRVVPVSIGILDFRVKYEEMRIDDVVVKAEPLVRMNDTLVYMVEAYIDSLSDRSIGDVLKKMPGIEVARGGQIYYNNRLISNFYIEGLDLTNGRYGVVVNNIRAKDISKVEVVENYQPIKALEGIDFSPDAAINLKLKNSAKGSFIATMQLGLGYKPWMWDGELAMMYFTGRWQTLTIYKTNNAGKDITSEFNSFYNSFASEYSLLSVHYPSTPSIDNERYMDNHTHVVSIDNVFKLRKESDRALNVNILYSHDKQGFKASSLTAYYLPGSPPLEMDETTSVTTVSDETELKIKYNWNDKNIYLNEQLAFGAQWNNDVGSVQNGNEWIDQEFGMKQLRLQNDIGFTKVLDYGVRMSFNSRIKAVEMPSNLRLAPLIYPEIFGYEVQNAVQTMSNRKFKTDNSLFINKTFPRAGVDIYAAVGFYADLQMMKSRLYDLMDPVCPDSLCNNLNYSSIDVNMSIGAVYRYRDFRIKAGVTPLYSHAIIEDFIVGKGRRKGKMFFNPYISMDWKIIPDLTLWVSGAINGNLGSPSDIYSGYIMTDYRSIGSKDGAVAEFVTQNYRVEMSYSNALRSLFASVAVDYRRRNSNLMYGTEYSGSLSKVNAYNINNMSQGWSIKGKMEKRFNAISTTIGVPVGYNRDWMDILRQKEIMKTSTWNLPVGLEVLSRFSSAASLEYCARYVYSVTEMEDNGNDVEYLTPINALYQKLGLNLIFIKSLTFSLRGEHYFNDAITSGSRNMFFLDASLTFKTKKIEYILEGRNLVNSISYNQRIYSYLTDYSYSYRLRPVSVIFKVKFSIGA